MQGLRRRKEPITFYPHHVFFFWFALEIQPTQYFDIADLHIYTTKITANATRATANATRATQINITQIEIRKTVANITST